MGALSTGRLYMDGLTPVWSDPHKPAPHLIPQFSPEMGDHCGSD
jgi:hypothetical protein